MRVEGQLVFNRLEPYYPSRRQSSRALSLLIDTLRYRP